MASPEVLEIAALIEPIQADQPVGEDPRADSSPTSLYYQVKDTRSQARAAERQAQMTGDPDAEPADWRPILTTAPELLTTRAKDLEIVAYLIEALCREHGFAGLRDGFRLTRELIERYGDTIFPLPDEDGVETRVAPLTGLNGDGADGTLLAPIGQIPLTDVSSVGAFGTSDYTQAQDLQRSPEEARERRISQGAVSIDTFQIAVNESTSEFYGNLLEDLEAAISEFSELTSVMDAKFAEFSPPSSNIRQALEQCKTTVESVARDKLATLAPPEPEVDDTAAEGEATGEDTGKRRVVAPGVGVIENREDAFREILKISQYFRKTEPHSPISYALEQIVRWGRLPLPDLLKELISDESSVSQMFRLVGIRSLDDAESSEYS